MQSVPLRLVRAMRRNWASGMMVALVNIPLSISLAIASHATPLMGILTAVWAGFVAAIFGGSAFNIVGPTGALSGLLAAAAIQFGPEVLPILALVTGACILLCAIVHLEKYIVFIPSSVMHGFTLGVACIIAFSQLPFVFGIDTPATHTSFILNVWSTLMRYGEADPWSVGVFGISVMMLFAFLRFVPRVPAPIVVTILGIGAGYASSRGWLPFQLQTLFTRYGEIQMSLMDPPVFSWSFFQIPVLKAALAVALIAVLETLLSAKIADGMTGTRFDQRREMWGIGAANIVSGITGGIPATAALARTALNVKSGADSRASSALNAIFVLIITLLLFPAFRYLPLPVVGAMLVYVAVRMVEAEHFFALYRFDPTTFLVSAGVAVLTVAWDPIVGILAGTAASLLLFVQQLSKGQSEISLHRKDGFIARIPCHRLSEFDHHGDAVVYRIAGEMTYFNGAAHRETLKRLHGCSAVVFSLRNLFYLDLDGRDMLGEIVAEQQAAGRRVLLSSSSDSITALLRHTSWYRALEKSGHTFPNARMALTAAGCQ